MTRDIHPQRLLFLSLEGGEICHRHRRHPQDPQDEVQRWLVYLSGPSWHAARTLGVEIWAETLVEVDGWVG